MELPEGSAGAALTAEVGDLRTRLRRQAMLIVGLYAVLAGTWIATSDRILGALVRDPELLIRVSVYKGTIFVAATSCLLAVLSRRTLRIVDRALYQVQHKEAERQQHEVERRRAETIIQSTADAVISKTFDGTVTSWNRAAEEMFGYAASEMLGRNVSVLIPDDRLEEEARIIGRVGNGEPLIEFETTRRRRDGSTFPAIITFSSLPSESPQAAPGVSAIVRDATARKNAEAAARRERGFAADLIEAMPGVFYLYDEEGRFLRWNRNFERVSGYSGAEISNMSPLDFFGPADTNLLTERIGEVFRLGESSVEAPFLAKDGTATSHFFTGKRIQLDGVTCLVGVGVDISERKQAERALRELNEELERKVLERTRDLDAAKERAEAADRTKSAFLANMSHELRTPLNSILGFTGIVLQKLAGPLTPEQAKQLGMVQSSARHLLDLINDVLDISKIEAGQLTVRSVSFDLEASIERVVASVTPFAERKGLKLQVEVCPLPHPMVSDQRRVEQILLNLLNNAIKFTDEGQVTLSVHLETTPHELVCVRVADTGIGMKESDLDRLFQPFHQVDSGLQRQHEGTGLGLAICRRLADLLGGTIAVRSSWGRGSVFTVSLPLRRA